MAKKLTHMEIIESWFIRASSEESIEMIGRINLILRTKGAVPGTGVIPQATASPAKLRGRPRKIKAAPPLTGLPVSHPEGMPPAVNTGTLFDAAVPEDPQHDAAVA